MAELGHFQKGVQGRECENQGRMQKGQRCPRCPPFLTSDSYKQPEPVKGRSRLGNVRVSGEGGGVCRISILIRTLRSWVMWW